MLIAYLLAIINENKKKQTVWAKNNKSENADN